MSVNFFLPVQNGILLLPVALVVVMVVVVLLLQSRPLPLLLLFPPSLLSPGDEYFYLYIKHWAVSVLHTIYIHIYINVFIRPVLFSWLFWFFFSTRYICRNEKHLMHLQPNHRAAVSQYIHNTCIHEHETLTAVNNRWAKRHNVSKDAVANRWTERKKGKRKRKKWNENNAGK